MSGNVTPVTNPDKNGHKIIGCVVEGGPTKTNFLQEDFLSQNGWMATDRVAGTPQKSARGLPLAFGTSACASAIRMYHSRMSAIPSNLLMTRDARVCRSGYGRAASHTDGSLGGVGRVLVSIGEHGERF